MQKLSVVPTNFRDVLPNFTPDKISLVKPCKATWRGNCIMKKSTYSVQVGAA